MNKEKCWCLEAFRKINPEVQGTCLKFSCARYRREKQKEGEINVQVSKVQERNGLDE
jgi:hypothetical protein